MAKIQVSKVSKVNEVEPKTATSAAAVEENKAQPVIPDAELGNDDDNDDDAKPEVKGKDHKAAAAKAQAKLEGIEAAAFKRLAIEPLKVGPENLSRTMCPKRAAAMYRYSANIEACVEFASKLPADSEVAKLAAEIVVALDALRLKTAEFAKVQLATDRPGSKSDGEDSTSASIEAGDTVKIKASKAAEYAALGIEAGTTMSVLAVVAVNRPVRCKVKVELEGAMCVMFVERAHLTK